MSESVLQNLLGTGLETIGAVSLLIIFVLILRRPVARWLGAQAAYALWALPALRLLIPALPANWSPITLPQISALWARETAPVIEAVPVEEAVSVAVPVRMTTDPATGVPLAPETEFASFVPSTSQEVFFNWSLIALSIWLGGTVLYLGLLFWKQWQFARTVSREATPAPAALQQQADEISAQIGLTRSPRVAMSLISKCPMVTGMVNPIVLLPAWFEEDYSSEDQYAALLHELTHLRRRDLPALVVAETFVAVQWFNPFAHYALRLFRVDQEAACDANVLTRAEMNRHAYASTLVKAARLSSPVSYPALAAGLPPTNHLKERLNRMKSTVPTSPARRLGTSLIALTGAAALFISACTTAAEENTFIVAEGENSFVRKGDFSISESRFYVDGEEIKDRRFILLSDPFKDLEPRLDQLDEIDIEMPEIDAEMELEMAKFEAEMAKLELKMAEIKMPEPPVEPVAPEIIEEKVEGGTRVIIPQQEYFIPDNVEEIERIAEQMALKSEIMAAHAGKIAEKHEAIAAKVEMKISSIMTEEFEAEIEAAADVVHDLADKCVEEGFAGGPYTIVSAQNDKSETFRALCVKGDARDLYSTETEAFIAQSDLTEDERANFYEDRDAKVEFRR